MFLTGLLLNFDNVMMKFIINKRTDILKPAVSLFFTIRTQNGQMLGIIEGKNAPKGLFSLASES